MDGLARWLTLFATLVGFLFLGFVTVEAASAGGAERKGKPPVDRSGKGGELCPGEGGTVVEPPEVERELVADPCEVSTNPGPSAGAKPEPRPDPADKPSPHRPAPGPSRPGTGGISPPGLGGPGDAGHGGPGDEPGGGRPDKGEGGERRGGDGSREGSARSSGAGARDRADRGTPNPTYQPSSPSPPSYTSDEDRIPSFLIPIYRECGAQYGIPWRVLAAINQIESAFGTNMGPSTAGAIGWMQFLPSTWAVYGVDADLDGRRNPNDADDAICAAARYLRAAGAQRDLRAAIFAYNHAGWYVDAVIALARSYRGIDVRDPLPRSKRLDRDFARDLARVARRRCADWALVLAVLRAEGERGRVPASLERVRALAERLSDVGRVRADRFARRVESGLGKRRAPIDEVTVLARFNHAIGLRGLITGLHRDRNRLERRVLESKHLEIYADGRKDISADRVDVRVLALLLYLAEHHDEVTVTSLITGHGYYARPGVPSAHSFGRAVDIAAVDGETILGNQRRGGIAEQVVRGVLWLPRGLRPEQVISLLDLGGPSFAAGDHRDHIHIGY